PRGLSVHAASVLVVTGDPLERDALLDVLGDERYLLFPARTVREGVALSREVLVDGAVVNARLPDGSGLDFIRAMDRLPREAFVLLAADISSAERGVRTLKTPCDLAALLSAV